ncbi:MAG: hypothetical protein RB292_03060 [Patescibacteria group bacterium]|jgi:hypothetical protein|nr:hypothetical protein [Patescibacteria group bacterium]
MSKENQKDDLEAVRLIAETLENFSDQERERIIRWSLEKLGTEAGSFPSVKTSPSVQTGVAEIVNQSASASTNTDILKPKDIKSFVDSKDPKSDKELAAVVAFYYAFEMPDEEKKESIGSKDLTEACRLAQRRRPKDPAQTLRNSAYAGYLDNIERGQYKINSVGENLVAMILPGKVESTQLKNKKPRTNTKKTQSKRTKKSSKRK